MKLFIDEIIEIKKLLEKMRLEGLVSDWVLPFENIFTNLRNAVFFVTPASAETEPAIWKELNKFNNFSFRLNTEKTLSSNVYRVTFNKDEKKRNLRMNE